MIPFNALRNFLASERLHRGIHTPRTTMAAFNDYVLAGYGLYDLKPHTEFGICVVTLVDTYADDITNTHDIYDRDLSAWRAIHNSTLALVRQWPD